MTFYEGLVIGVYIGDLDEADNPDDIIAGGVAKANRPSCTWIGDLSIHQH